MRSASLFLIIISICLLTGSSCKKKAAADPGTMQLSWTKVGSVLLVYQGSNKNIPADSIITIAFNSKLDAGTVSDAIVIKKPDQSKAGFRITLSGDLTTIRLALSQPLEYLTSYSLQVGSTIKGSNGELFPGVEYAFTTLPGAMKVEQATINGVDFRTPAVPRNIDWKSVSIQVRFSMAVDTAGYKSCFVLSGNIPLSCSLSADQKTVTAQSTKPLAGVAKYTFAVTSDLKAKNGYTFDGFLNSFYTALDTTPKFPVITDDELLTLIQQKTFRYFYDFGHPASGMARERNSSGDIVTTGGSGFGVMALVVGMDRHFITRDDGLARLGKILTFLETCDRFHGAWPHWINGATGKTVPFTTQDDGADLVETSYMVEGLITVRQYLAPGVPGEQLLIDRINVLLNGVEYDWFTRGQHVLYWYWSPDYNWAMNMQIRGYNETLITYVVAATSTAHPILPAVYHEGYAQNGAIKNGSSYYGYVLPLGESFGGPLFFTHYSFLGLNPTNLSDSYANYWLQNVNQSLINWAYCKQNPRNWVGYSASIWGLTASDNPWGYNAHSPTNDLGVITPTAAISALPYTPEQSLKAIHQFYYSLGDRLWGEYGFYDSFDLTEGWWADSTLAIDEGPIICMIENYRTGLLWNLFMSAPEVNAGLTKLGFTH
ncbi:MAG: glucoamylase family protein [Bacteroidota bacterium]